MGSAEPLPRQSKHQALKELPASQRLDSGSVDYRVIPAFRVCLSWDRCEVLTN